MSKLQEKPSALKREHAVLQNMKFLNFFLFLWVLFALLDSDPNPDLDPLTWLNPDRIRIWNTAFYVLLPTLLHLPPALVPELFLPDVVVEPVEHVVVEGDHVDRKAGGALLTEHAVAPHLPDIPLLSYLYVFFIQIKSSWSENKNVRYRHRSYVDKRSFVTATVAAFDVSPNGLSRNVTTRF
jgi:hypothetical protein